MTISEALQEIVETLKGTGIAATSDGGRMEFPGVLVVPSTMEFPYLDNESFDMEFNLFLMTRDNSGSVDVWSGLQELLQKVRSVYPIEEALPINKPNSSNSNPAPALLVVLKTRIS